jgi:hypothetical protein
MPSIMGLLTAGKVMYARPCSTKYCFYHASTYMLYPYYNQMKEMSSLVWKTHSFVQVQGKLGSSQHVGQVLQDIMLNPFSLIWGCSQAGFHFPDCRSF